MHYPHMVKEFKHKVILVIEIFKYARVPKQAENMKFTLDRASSFTALIWWDVVMYWYIPYSRLHYGVKYWLIGEIKKVKTQNNFELLEYSIAFRQKFISFNEKHENEN